MSTPDRAPLLHTVVAFPRSDGGVCFVSSFHADARAPGESDEAFIWRRALLDVPTGRPFKIVPAIDVPFHDRTFRDCWTMSFVDPDGHGGPYGCPSRVCDFGQPSRIRPVFDHNRKIVHDPRTNELVGIDLSRAIEVHRRRMRLTAWGFGFEVDNPGGLHRQMDAAMETASTSTGVAALYDIWPALLLPYRAVWAHCYERKH